MWFGWCIVAACLLESVYGNEFDMLELINHGIDICKLTIPGKCGEHVAKGCRTKATWLMFMQDASAKLQSGIFEGNTANLGSFDECLEIDLPTEDIRGKYCLGTAELQISKNNSYSNIIFAKKINNEMISKKPIILTSAICVPDSCSADYIQKYIFPGDGIFSEDQCQTKSGLPTWTTGDNLAISFFVIMGAIIISSTAYDYYLQVNSIEPKSIILISFSLITNGRQLLKISTDSSQIQCIHGLRAISVMWIILTHTFYTRRLTSAFNTLDMYTWFASQDAMFVSGAVLAVDTFFLISGIMMVYAFLKSKPEGGFFNVPMYYLHRYLRLTPSMAVLLLVHVTLIKHMGSGPLWPSAKSFMYDFCVEYWWTTLLYIQNWVNRFQLCIGVTWYLCVDMQLFILSPLILIPLKKYTKTTLCVVFLFSCASIGACFHAAWVYNLNGLGSSSEEYMTMYYTATYTRAAPWLIGSIAGYFLHEIKSSRITFKPNKILVWGLWIVSLVVMCACAFGGNDLKTVYRYNKPLNSVFLTFVRPSWSIAISWLVIACASGYGGPVNTILSLWPFQFIAKISYNMYLLHLSIMQLFTFSSRTSIGFSPLWELYFFWAHFTVTCAIATAWSLAFEVPIIVLDKHLLGSPLSKNKEQKNVGSITDVATKQ